MKYAIVDIETTGSYAGANSITEIALIVTDGQAELERFETLLKPDHLIPNHITHLTGITNEMVSRAPRFEEIMSELEDILSDCIFIAHNVGFDFSFIKKQFEEHGRRWNRPKMCTVRMTREIVPGLSSYSLSNLCRHFNIVNKQAHRAMADVEATFELFKRLQAQDENDVIKSWSMKRTPSSWLPPRVSVDEFEKMPEAPGVYYFKDAKGTPLYIGMSMNIKERVKQHFTGKLQSARRQDFLRDVSHLDFIETKTAFIARLLEDHEIRSHWPKYNYAQKAMTFKFGLVQYLDQNGFLRWSLQKIKKGQQPFLTFQSETQGRDYLYLLAREHQIPYRFFGLADVDQLEDPEIEMHNHTLNQLRQDIVSMPEQFLVVESLADGSSTIVLVGSNGPVSFGIIPDDTVVTSAEVAMDWCNDKLSNSPTVAAILRNQLQQKNTKVYPIENAFDLGNQSTPIGQSLTLF